MTISRFLVECFWPGVTREQVEAANARATAAALHSASLRFLGSLLVPSDEVVLFHFTASSSEEVVGTSREAKLPFDRIAESVWLEAAAAPPSRIGTNLVRDGSGPGRTS